MAKECTEPRKVQCRNCDEFGHMSRECPKPRDSKSFCSHSLNAYLLLTS